MSDVEIQEKVDGAVGYAHWVAAAVTADDRVRIALRYAANPATEMQAYKYVARFWADRDYLRTPILLHASLVANMRKLHNSPGVSLGSALADAQRQRVPLYSPNSLDTALLSLEGMTLRTAYPIISGWLSNLNNQPGRGVDWGLLFTRHFHHWDAPRNHVWARRRIAEDFYQNLERPRTSTKGG